MISPFQKLSFNGTMTLTYVYKKPSKENSELRKDYLILSGSMGEASVRVQG